MKKAALCSALVAMFAVTLDPASALSADLTRRAVINLDDPVPSPSAPARPQPRNPVRAVPPQTQTQTQTQAQTQGQSQVQRAQVQPQRAQVQAQTRPQNAQAQAQNPATSAQAQAQAAQLQRQRQLQEAQAERQQQLQEAQARARAAAARRQVRRPPVRRAGPKEEAVDLNAMEGNFIGSSRSNRKGTSAAPQGEKGESGYPSGMAYGAPHEPSLLPNFKFYFDFWLINQPGVQDFTFRNIHSYTFVDVLPNKELTFSFSFNLNSRANYFELAYQPTRRLQFRGGKILIPFDDTFPHTLYGGRINISEFLLNPQQPFLPDLWAELGVAMKYRLIDSSGFTFDAQAYVTNGFQANGTDPLNASGPYPDFKGDQTIGGADNNRDKALGGRLNALLFRKLGFGLSYYRARWSPQASAPYYLHLLGADSQLRFSSTGTEFRAGLLTGSVDLPGSSFNRGGWYGEVGQKFGTRREWKALFRAGYRQNDDRVIEVQDQKIVGGVLLWRPGLVQWSLEHSRDLNEVPGKQNYTLTALRAAVEL